MKILIIMGGFFPGRKYGGPPVSINNFCSLMDSYECYIVTRNHDLFEDEPFPDISEGWNQRDNCKVLYLTDACYKKSRFEQVILEVHPDVIYIQGLFQTSVLPCLQLARKHSIHVLLAPRGELCQGAFNIKKFKKIPYVWFLKMQGLFKKIDFQSTSTEEKNAIHTKLSVAPDRIWDLPNIPSVPTKKYKKKTKVAGIGNFVFLSRIHPKKNLLFAIELLSKVQGMVNLYIYGSIEDEEYWNQCQKRGKSLHSNISINYMGLAPHDEVAAIFSRYDAFIFPTLSENYGHVIAESLSVGTPVIVSNQTPWIFSEKDHAGWSIPLEETECFVRAINEIVAADENEMNHFTTSALTYFREHTCIETTRQAYMEAFGKIIAR